MKAFFLRIAGVAAILCFVATQSAIAQRRPTTTDKTAIKPAAAATKPSAVSAEDQKAIVKLFEGVDPSKYRLEFNNKQRVAGQRAVQMKDLEQVHKVNNPAEAAGYIVFVVEGNDVIYVLAVGSSNLESVLGKAKATQLKAIMAKYSK